ncbi:MAG: ADP-glyceromanno-heptose 6-epimerase [Ignavibacteriae bacterium]|nr:MAG: ADP-glyceromanno-heptose 6-epimerase [Ignavibacteriota bacterium]
MKIITGGAGFIGSAICWKLNLMGFNDVLLVDSDMEGTKKCNLAGLKYSDFIDKDMFLKEISSGKIDENTDTLYHMGACSSTTEEDMDFLQRNNVEYSRILAEWSLKNNIRYVYASSAATYGDGSLGFDDDLTLIPKLKPLNKYGLSKQIFDIWVLENKLNNKIVGLKYFNVYGPNENHKGSMRSMVNKSFAKIMETGKMQLFKSERPEYKDGEQKRDFLYVKDAVDMTVFFDITNPVGKDKNGIFNIGSGKASTWLDMTYALFKAVNKIPDIEFVDMPDNIRNQYQYFTQAKMEKIRDAGFTGEITSLEEGVRDYVQNYLMPDKYLSVNEQ